MTTAGNGHRVPYKVTMSGQTKALLKSLHLQEAEAGRGQKFLAALREIVPRLQADPMIFGEPLYNLPALKLQVRKGVIVPLVVDYAVHQELPYVFIHGFKLLS